MEIIASLEIGSSKVTCLIASQKYETEIEVLGVGVEYCDVLNRGHLINVELASNAIEEAVKKAELMSGVEVTHLFLSIPSRICEGKKSDGKVAIANKNGEREVGLEDIERVIEMAETTVKIPSDQTIVHSIPMSFKVDDHVYEEPLGIIGLRLEVDVYLVLCSKNILESFNRAVMRAGYEVADMTLETLAAAEAVLVPDEKKAKSVVIDLGSEYTSAIIYQGRSLVKLVHLDVGGANISQDISYGVKTTKEEGERIKKVHGAADTSLVEDKKIEVPMISYKKFVQVSKRGIAQIIAARLEEIFILIKEELEKMSDRESKNPIGLNDAGVVLVGGNALIRGCEMISERVFNQPSRVGDPLSIGGLDSEIHQANYATVVGLLRVALDRMEEDEGATKFSKIAGLESKRGSRTMTKKLKHYFKNFFT